MQKKFEGGVLRKPLAGQIKDFDSSGQRLNCKLEIIELRRTGFRTLALWDSDTPDDVHFAISSKSWEETEKKEIQGKNFRVVSRYTETSNPPSNFKLFSILFQTVFINRSFRPDLDPIYFFLYILKLQGIAR